MELSLSTRWNASRHRAGAEMIDEILGLGFDRVELGFDLTLDLVAGVRDRVESGRVTISSVHSYCPVPLGAPFGHPELYTLADANSAVRRSAVRHMANTIHFASDLGAPIVIAHAGRVPVRSRMPKLCRLLAQGKRHTEKYERIRNKLVARREKKSEKALDRLYASLDELAPLLEEKGVALALENLPLWEAVPTEAEMCEILARYPSGPIRYWHDLGHAQVRETMGFARTQDWLPTLAPRLAGIHVHEARGPHDAHQLPFTEKTDFSALKNILPSGTLCVFEPAPHIAAEVVADSAALFRSQMEPLDPPPGQKDKA